MLKYKYQIIIIIIVAVVSGLIGSSFTGHNKDKEIEKLVIKHRQELKLAIEQERVRLQILDNELLKLDRITKQDSLLIEGLNDKIKENDLKTKQKLKAVTKLTPNEKKNWLMRRYAPDSIR